MEAGASFTVSTQGQKQFWVSNGLGAAWQPVVIGECVAYTPVLVSWAMGEAIKTRHAGGHEYFLFHGELEPEEQVIGILKAFSKFKKRHHTNMALVLLSDGMAPVGLMAKLSNYAFRNAVFVVEHIGKEEKKQLLASCYAFIAPQQQNLYSRRLLEAMVQGTCCLVEKGSTEEEIIAANAIAYGNIDELFLAMSKCFVDESLKNQYKQTVLQDAEKVQPQTVWSRLMPLLLPEA